MKATLRIIGLIGAVLFGVVLLLTFVSPLHYEKAARGFITHKIEQKIQERIDIGEDSRVGNFAKALLEKHRQQIKDIKERLLPVLQAKIGIIVARMQDNECECRERMAQTLSTIANISAKLHISSLEKAEPQLQRLIEGNYGAIVSDLMRDLRIFSGTNLVAFISVLLLSFLKPGFLRQLFVPGLLLAIASIVASIIYVFGQNWFFALLYNNYVGMAYMVWITVIYGFLCDIALFNARITSAIVEGVVSALPHALNPC